DSLNWTTEEKVKYQQAALQVENFEKLRQVKREREKQNEKNKKEGKPEVETPANEPDPKTILNDAATRFADLLKGRPNSPAFLYDYACLQAQLGQPDEAMKSLD